MPEEDPLADLESYTLDPKLARGLHDPRVLNGCNFEQLSYVN